MYLIYKLNKKEFNLPSSHIKVSHFTFNPQSLAIIRSFFEVINNFNSLIVSEHFRKKSAMRVKSKFSAIVYKFVGFT